MRRTAVAGIVFVGMLLVMSSVAFARIERGEKSEERGPLRVAVLDFETKGKEVADLGGKVADLLTVFLSTEEDLELVERAQLKEVLQELELGASGIVDPNQATRIGGLLGAQVLITGRAFIVNEKLYLVAKAISVETSRVNAQIAKGELDMDLDVIVQELSGNVAEWLSENADKMVAEIETPQDKVKALRRALGKKKLPVASVKVIETHVGQPMIDPAAETEVVYLMRKVGIPVLSGKDVRISDWAREFVKDANVPLPPSARNADVLIVGEGFSEYAGRRSNLISVKARMELKAVDCKSGRIIGIARKTVTVVDLSEQIAGKTALQRAAGEAAAEMLPEVVAQWNNLREEERKAKKKEKADE